METPEKVRKSRASSSDQARKYRQQGHDDALLFAESIGLDKDYKNDLKAKKDVIDPSGDAHSVKSGQIKWQIFLYGLNRFESDPFFKVMNGIGQHLIDCINSFPKSFEEYQSNKKEAKEKLRPNMVALAEKLKDKHRLRAFLSKSLFNGGEVNYLTIYNNKKFHVFWGKEVEQIMTDKFEVANSRAIKKGDTPEQKVLLRYNGTNVGEIEMRNDSPVHYREIRFNMVKPMAMKLLYDNIKSKKEYNDKVILYGEATRHFGRWAEHQKLVYEKTK